MHDENVARRERDAGIELRDLAVVPLAHLAEEDVGQEVAVQLE
jgi:hypothetical protein